MFVIVHLLHILRYGQRGTVTGFTDAGAYVLFEDWADVTVVAFAFSDRYLQKNTGVLNPIPLIKDLLVQFIKVEVKPWRNIKLTEQVYFNMVSWLLQSIRPESKEGLRITNSKKRSCSEIAARHNILYILSWNAFQER